MDYIALARTSPLLQSCGFSQSDLDKDSPRWTQASELILSALEFDGPNLTSQQKSRVFDYYLPIVMWIQRLRAERTEPGPLVLGISAPQGCGKSTLVECLYKVLEKLEMKTASVSIDDFYLTNSDQNALAEKYSDNPLLQCRGNALTHDLPLGTSTLQKLKGEI